MANLVKPVRQTGGRINRYPQHPFHIEMYPWAITPFFIAPVLPGETLTNLQLQARAVSDVVKNRLVGWWLEHYFFYVKHRDLADRDEFVEMMLDPAWSSANVDQPTVDQIYYHAANTSGNINWMKLCYQRIVEEYFRDGEAWNTHTVKSQPAAAITGKNVLSSMVPFADLTFPDADVDLNADDTITIGEIDRARIQYDFLKANYAVDISYEDFLRSYGVSIPGAEELHKPELIRFTRNWQQPVAAINASTGAAAAAVVWDVQERADKDRFFKEPGFVVGVTVARPKVYLSGQKGSLTGAMKTAYSWLPAVLTNDLRTSLVNIPDNDVLGDVTDAGGAWVDIRDLFLYGEQFTNISLSDAASSFVALPDATLNQQWPADADIDGLFTGSVNSARRVRQEGIVSLNVRSRQIDQTAGV